MEAPNGNVLEWFYDDNGDGFDRFIGGQGEPITDGKLYPSDDTAIQAGLAYEALISQSPAPNPPASPPGASNHLSPNPET